MRSMRTIPILIWNGHLIYLGWGGFFFFMKEATKNFMYVGYTFLARPLGNGI